MQEREVWGHEGAGGTRDIIDVMPKCPLFRGSAMIFYRTELLCCHDDQDFLAKVHCVRLAFDDLVACDTHRTYFVDVGRSLMSVFLQETNQDAALFVERYNALTRYLEIQDNWDVAKNELTARKVSSSKGWFHN